MHDRIGEGHENLISVFCSVVRIEPPSGWTNVNKAAHALHTAGYRHDSPQAIAVFVSCFCGRCIFFSFSSLASCHVRFLIIKTDRYIVLVIHYIQSLLVFRCTANRLFLFFPADRPSRVRKCGQPRSRNTFDPTERNGTSVILERRFRRCTTTDF